MAGLERRAFRGVSRAGVVGAGVVAACALGAAVAASRGASATATGGDDLRRDLDAAAASAAFAPASHGAAPVRFVSPLELGESPTPAGPTRAVGPAPAASRHALARTRVLRSVQHSTTLHVPVRTVAERTPAVAPAPAGVTPDAAPGPRATEQVAAATAAPATAGAGTYTAPTDVAPAAASGPSAGPSGDAAGDGGATPVPRGRGGWGGIGGGVIGVVIRGGIIGDADHCERDHPHGRLPLPGSIGGGMGGGHWPGRGRF